MTDIGLQLVDSLYEQLMVDDQWSVRHERGFSWWSYRLAQHIEVGAPERSVDRDVCSVRIWTDVVREVDPAANPAQVLGPLNVQATLNALAWDSATANITECCTAQVHDENLDWMGKVLATAAVLQNASAHARADFLAGECRGVPAATTHPSSGERLEMDDLLNVPATIAGEGGEPSRFAGPRMERAGRFLERMQFFGSADSTGLMCQIPFTGRESASVPVEAPQPQTSLVQVFTDVAHPEFGGGMLVVMRLPVHAETYVAALQANELNVAEVQGESQNHLLGAWCPDPTSAAALAFCCFVPNVLANSVVVENLVSYQGGRSMFAAERLKR